MSTTAWVKAHWLKITAVLVVALFAGILTHTSPLEIIGTAAVFWLLYTLAMEDD